MAIDLTETPVSSSKNEQTTIVNEQLFCALTGERLHTGEVYWAPPLVTARELVSTVFSTLVHAPGNLGHVLFTEQPNVPYAPSAREQLAARRNAEQLKLLVGLLVAVALIAAPILLMAMR